MQRENFKSRTGFLLVSAGCAIGIGNVWRFPYVTGENGGGLFVLFYLAFLVLMGIPVLTMELAVGRASRKSAVLSYKTLEKPKSKWHIHGWLCMIGCYLLMMFYTPVSAWMLDYFYKFATGTFKSGMNSEQVSGVFNDLMTSPVEMIIWLAIIVVFGFFVCSRGLQKGIEKVSKVMMLALLALIIILAINSMMLSNAGEGLIFYLVPDFGKVKDVGLGKVITSAMSQAFFTLGLNATVVEELSKQCDIKLIGIDDAAVKKLKNTYSYVNCKIPKNTYNGQSDEVGTVAVKAVLIVNDRLSVEQVKKLTQLVFDNAQELQLTVSADVDITLEKAVEGVKIPFHKGAAEYYSERGITVKTAG